MYRYRQSHYTASEEMAASQSSQSSQTGVASKRDASYRQRSSKVLFCRWNKMTKDNHRHFKKNFSPWPSECFHLLHDAQISVSDFGHKVAETLQVWKKADTFEYHDFVLIYFEIIFVWKEVLRSTKTQRKFGLIAELRSVFIGWLLFDFLPGQLSCWLTKNELNHLKLAEILEQFCW